MEGYRVSEMILFEVVSLAQRQQDSVNRNQWASREGVRGGDQGGRCRGWSQLPMKGGIEVGARRWRRHGLGSAARGRRAPRCSFNFNEYKRVGLCIGRSHF